MKAAEAGARVHVLSEKLHAIDRRWLADPRLRTDWATSYLLDEIEKARREVFSAALLDFADVSALASAVFEALHLICATENAIAGRHRCHVLAIRAAVARLTLAVADLGGVSDAQLAEVCACDTVEIMGAATGAGA